MPKALQRPRLDNSSGNFKRLAQMPSTTASEVHLKKGENCLEKKSEILSPNKESAIHLAISDLTLLISSMEFEIF